VLESKTSLNSSIVVIDVRDDDYVGGHIPGAVNVPSTSWGDTRVVDRLVDDFVLSPDKEEKKTIIFHCMQSKQRGVLCASKFASRLAQVKLEKPDISTEV
jgi:Cdc25 family phosphatase